MIIDQPESDADLAAGQLAFELGHTTSHAVEDFVVSDGNRLALSHIQAFPRWAHPLTLLLGPAKAGKSHLARIWAEGAHATQVSPETLDSIVADPRRAPLLIEDIDRQPFSEAPLFHLLNSSMRDNRPILITAREPVLAWPYRTQDVKSRARLATQFTIEPAGDTALSQIFAKLFSDRQVSVPRKVIQYLLPRMERSPEEAAVLVEMMDRLALARGTPITRRIAAEALGNRRSVGGEDSSGPTAWEGEDDE